MIKGNGVSTGIGFGTVVVLRKENKQIEKNVVENPEEEMKRFKEALSKVTDETEQIVEKASGTEREIMNAYLMILQDPTLIAETGNAIMNQNYNAEYAVEVGFNNVIQIFENMDDEYMAGRARDIADIKERILAKLSNIEIVDLSQLHPNTIIVATELTTSDTAKLNFKNVVGIITEVGGENSHTSIMARTHAIPAITKVKDATKIFNDGENVALNGATGEIYQNPTQEEREKLEKIEEHITKSKNGAKYTKSHNAIKLETAWRSKDKSLACKLEYYIKTLNKQQKESLIKGQKLSTYLSGKVDCRRYKRIV